MKKKDFRHASDLDPGDTVQALSLWEPWASLMATGAKTIETRGQPMRYRGPLLICASKHKVLRDLRDLLDDPDFQRGLEHLPVEMAAWPDDLNFGHAVAIVDLVDCVPTSELLASDRVGADAPFGDFSAGRFGLVTTRCRRINPFPVKGQQGLFSVQLPADFADFQAAAVPSRKGHGDLFGATA